MISLFRIHEFQIEEPRCLWIMSLTEPDKAEFVLETRQPLMQGESTKVERR